LGAARRRDSGGVKWKSLGWDSCSGEDDQGLYGAPEVPLKKFLTFDKFDEIIRGKVRSPDDSDYTMWQAVVGKVREIAE